MDSSGPNDAQVQLYSPGCANVPSLNHLSTAAIRALLPAALRAAHRDGYLIYSEADFEVSRPAGATRRSPPTRQISPPSVLRKGCRTPKTEIFTHISQYVEYERPEGAYHLRDFHKTCRVSTPFQDALAVKMWLDLLKRLWSYGGFNLRGLVTPKFSAPSSGETMRQNPTF